MSNSKHDISKKLDLSEDNTVDVPESEEDLYYFGWVDLTNLIERCESKAVSRIPDDTTEKQFQELVDKD